MKILRCFILFTFISPLALAQTTSYDTDFSSGHPFEDIYDWSEGEITGVVEDGALKVSYDKSEDALWNRLIFWVKPFDFGSAPYCTFKIKGDKDFQMVLDFKDENDGVLSTSFDVGQEYTEVSLDLSAELADLKSNILAELQWDVGMGNDSGTFWLDDFKMGTAAAPPPLPVLTRFYESFDDGQVPSYFVESEGYAFYNTGESLLIGVDKGSGESQNSFSVRFPNPLDLTDSAFMAMDLRVDQSVLTLIKVFDAEGSALSLPQRLIAADDFTTLSWKLDAGSSIDLSAITRLDINIGVEAFEFQGMLGMDELKLGGTVLPAASILPQEDPFFFSGTKGATLLITDVMNAESVELDGESVFIENIIPGEVENGIASLQFDCMDGVHGWERITLLARGAEGFEDGRTTLSLTIEGNQSPGMDVLADLELGWGDDSLIVVPVKGISDKNISLEQVLDLSVLSSDTSIVSVKEVLYESPLGTGLIHLTPRSAGMAQIYVTLSESEPYALMNDTFDIQIYELFNHSPTVDDPGVLKIRIGQAQDTLYLTGLSDGDDGSQSLSFMVSGSDEQVLQTISVEAIGGDSLMLLVAAQGTGSVQVELAITDDGGRADNNGDQTTTINFEVNVLDPPLTGYTADFSDVEADVASNIWTFPGSYQLSSADSSAMGYHAMRVDVNDKFYWDGMNLNLLPEGIELDLSSHPYLSMEVFPLDNNTLHWLWFYDYSGTRNDLNNRADEKLIWAEAGEWNELFFDFSGELDWQNVETGEDIDHSRIVKVLFDMHNTNFSWPPPSNYTGTFLIRNLKIGSDAKEAAEITKTPTMDSFSAGPYFGDTDGIALHLSGISNGEGSVEGLELQVSSNRESSLKVESISEISPDGKAVVNLSTGTPWYVQLDFTLKDLVSDRTLKITKNVSVLSAEFDQAVTAVVDMGQSGQQMRGFGCFYDPKYGDLFTNEMSASAVRIGLIGNQIEWANDNNDPRVLHMDALDWNAFDWEYFSQLREQGVEQFILTSWSPPAWMKDNLSISAPAAGHGDNTLQTRNRLSLHYYEEFAESMVAVVRMFKERCGIELNGIGLQNEPAFHEPYPSAILDPIHFRELLKVVGRRFEEEGIQTELYMPEQVFSQGYPAMEDYIDQIQKDEEANSLCRVIATHSYAQDGINSGAPDWSQWTNMWNNAQEGDHPKELWMSETNRHYGSFEDVVEVASGIQGALTAGNVSLWTQWNFAEQYLTEGKPNPMLYMMRNFAHFIRPGAVRLGSSSESKSLLISAFRHPDTQAVSILLVNLSKTDQTLDLSASGLPGVYDTYRTSGSENCSFVGTTDISGLLAIPAQSITTLHAIHSSALSMDYIPNMELEMNAAPQTLQLSGIGNGTGSIEGLSLDVETNQDALITQLELGELNSDGTCTLSFVPGSGMDGTAKITLTLKDGADEIREVFYVVVVDHTVGMGDVRPSAFFKVYPNPAQEMLHVDSDLPMLQIEVLSLGGSLCSVTPAMGVSVQEVDLSGLKPGLYLLRVTDSEGKRGHRSFVKQ